MKVSLTKKNCGNFVALTSKYSENVIIVVTSDTSINAKSLFSIMNLELPKEYEVVICTDNELTKTTFYDELKDFIESPITYYRNVKERK